MRRLLIPLLWLLAIQLHAAQVITGEIVGITDGDTVKLLTADKQQIKIRLSDIDTPEKKQPYGSRAKQALSDLVFREQVTAKVVTVDRYGRTVARLYVGDLDVNREMVRLGAAWIYRKYSKDQSLLNVEAEAKATKRGLWALPEAEQVPPWEWRRK
jgi:endonuclease YncB( thermonuclease family)